MNNRVRVVTFKNNSAMSWWSVLLVEETRVPAKNYRLVGNPNNPVVILRFAISSSSDSADRGRSIIRVNLSETTQPLSHNIVSNRVYIRWARNLLTTSVVMDTYLAFQDIDFEHVPNEGYSRNTPCALN